MPKKKKESFAEYLSRPRKTCQEIIPDLARTKEMKEENLRVLLERFQNMMQRARIGSIPEKLKHIADIDRSEKIMHHGEVSKRIFENIRRRRDFDLYAQPVILPKSKFEQQQENLLAAALGEEYKHIDNLKDLEIKQSQVPSIYEKEPVKIQPLITAAWNIGTREFNAPPVGFAAAPDKLSNSLGNEIYYSYDGQWKDGMMHGGGKYLYGDGSTYEGGFVRNRQDGLGTANYNNDCSYDGHWEKGFFHGKGTMSFAGGSQYHGFWSEGKRHGEGRLSLPCGLEYEGEWKDGLPHGRGRMTSRLYDYSYEGSFHKGSLFGGGTLTTPDGKKVIRFWNDFKPNFLLPSAVRQYLQEIEEAARLDKERRDELLAERREKLVLKYSVAVRTELHEKRALAKQEILDEKRRFARESRQALMDLKMKQLQETQAKYENVNR